MTGCLIGLGAAIGVVVGLIGIWVDRRWRERHRRREHFEPLPPLEPTPPLLVSRFPPSPVRVLPEPTFHDAEAEGWVTD